MIRHLHKLSFHSKIAVFSALLVVLLVGVGYTRNTEAQTGGQELAGYAWGATDDNGDGNPDGGPGWISFNCKNDNSCAASNYSVVLQANGDLVGYAWANAYDPLAGTSSYGWLKFGGLSGFPSGLGTYTTNAKIVSGQMQGWARFCSGTATSFQLSSYVSGDCTGPDRPDGWDGWVSLRGKNTSGGPKPDYGVSLIGKNLSGYAWGSNTNVGWINFSGVTVGSATASLKFYINGYDTWYDTDVVGSAPIVVTVASAVNPTQNVHLTWVPSGMASCSGTQGYASWAGVRDHTDITTLPHQWDNTITNNTGAPVDYPFFLTCTPANGGAPISQNGTVRVLPSVYANLSITYGTSVNVNSVNINSGDSITLNYSSGNVAPGSCDAVNLGYVTPDWYAATIVANIASTVPATPPTTGMPGLIAQYQFKCKKMDNVTDVFSNIVNVNLKEGSNLRLAFYDSANPNLLTPPNTKTLAYGPPLKVDLVWYAPTNATLKCTGLGLGAVPNPVPPSWTGGQADIPAGTATNTAIRPMKLSVVVPNVTQTTFYITCQAYTKMTTFPPETAFATVSLASTSSTPSIDLVANPGNVAVGGLTDLSWSSPTTSTISFTGCLADAFKIDASGTVSSTSLGITEWNLSTPLGLPPSSKANVPVPGADKEGVHYTIACKYLMPNPIPGQPVIKGTATDSADVIIGTKQGGMALSLEASANYIYVTAATPPAEVDMAWHSDQNNEYKSCKRTAFDDNGAPFNLPGWSGTISQAGSAGSPDQPPYSSNGWFGYTMSLELPTPAVINSSILTTLRMRCYTGNNLTGSSVVSNDEPVTVIWGKIPGGPGSGGKKPIYEECHNGICSNNDN